ncbi:MAG: hypothetical protein ABFC96_16105 [Thermoguttaceae bacterium]
MGKPTAMIADTFVFCPRCASRVDVGRLTVGSTLTCWSCDFKFVPARSDSQATAGQGRGAERQVQVEEPPIAFADREEQVALGLIPPLGLFFLGTFRFPFYLATLPQTILLSLGGIVLAAAIRLALWCYFTDNASLDSHTRVLLWNGLAFSVAFGGLWAFGCVCAAAACGLTILQETSHGADTIESWPDLLRLEGWGEVVYVSTAVMLSTLPGLVATPLWHWLAIPRSLGIAVAAPAFFPVILLSMLETRSAVNPVSLPVWRSLLYAWPAWLLFHVLALATAIVTAVLVAAAMRHTGLIVGVAVAGVLPTVAWLIYFRMLGRLAFCCSGRTNQA